MARFMHRLLLTTYILVVFIALVVLSYIGFSYYKLPADGIGRLDHPLYNLLKPSGIIGHGLGIAGTLIILVGLFGYMARKRLKIFSRIGILKYWLEFHIFLCTLGTIFVLFHTTFKFGGLVSIGWWSLILVWVSGVVGRFIYLQIPRSIEGIELTVLELLDLKTKLDNELLIKYQINFSEIRTSKFSQIRLQLVSHHISKKDYGKVRSLIQNERKLLRRMEHLNSMQRLFKYWHVIHLPFALIMLIIMAIHVSIQLFFGYNWIF